MTLDNPRRLNALTGAMLAGLDSGLAAIEAERAVRVVLIRATPGRAFSSGADITEWSRLSPRDFGARWVGEGNRIFNRLAALDAPSVAVLAADAYGGGLELALAADFRLAAQHARFGLPETGIGAIPGWHGIARLVPLVGLSRARRVALLGETVDAATAFDWGLVDGVAEPDGLEALVAETVAAVRARSATATAAAKKIIAAVTPAHDLDVIHALAAIATRTSADAEEGIRAFRAKERPDFSQPKDTKPR